VNPDNKDAVKSLRTICSGAVATIEAKLEAQKRSDAAEAIRLEAEEAKRKAEEERQQREEQRQREDAKLAEVRARAEQVRKMAEDQMDIERIRHEL
jgi:colicin import membrane protein